MALAHSPRIVTDGLVFYYDMGNQQKSWKGAPTTNLIGNPFCLNNSGPGITFSGYEASATVVSAINDKMRAISPFWIKYVKTSDTNGRVWFLGGGAGSFQTNTDYTYSVYVYTEDSGVTGFTLGSDNSGLSTTTQTLSSWSSSDIGRVKRIAAIFRSVAGSNSQGCRITSTNPIGTTFYMTAYQCEQQSIATPTVSGTRSNTQAILDLTNNNTITATSLTYNSDDTFSFNGSNNELTSGTTTIAQTSNITVEAVIKRTGSNSLGFIIGNGNTGSNGYWISLGTSGLTFSTGNGTTTVQHNAGTLLVDTTYHISGTFDGVFNNIYVNGVLISSQAVTGSLNYSSIPQNFKIGNLNGSGSLAGRWFQGDIYIAKIYNRALTAQEVQQNFNALRGRFGI